MAETRNLPSGQTWLLKRAESLGYTDLQGFCYGLSHVAMQAYLTDELGTFNKRLELINSIPIETFAEEIEDAKKKRVKLYADAQAEFLQGKIKEELSEEEKRKLYLYIQQKIDKEFNQRDKELIELSVFFDEIELLHRIYKYPELFEKGKAPKAAQQAKSAFEILKPQSLESEKGLVSCESFSGCYIKDKENNKDDLLLYFRTLYDAAKNSKHRMSFILSRGTHAVHLGYDPINNEWTFINANELPPKTFKSSSIDELTESVRNAFTKNDTTIFTTEVFVTGKHATEMGMVLDAWKSNPVWQEIHDRTPEKATKVDSYNTSWLFVAAKMGQVEIAEDLIKKGANVNQATNRGATPLFIASQNGHNEIVEALLKTDVNVNQATNIGATPLFIAARQGHFEIFAALIKKGANINTATKEDGATPLFVAAQNGHFDIVEALIRAGANINKATKDDGATPLFVAAQNGHFEIVKLLLAQSTIEINATMLADKDFLLRIAKKQNCSEKMTDLLRDKLPIIPGFTALHAAAFAGHTKVVLALLEKGSDVKSISNGVSALNLAKAMNHPNTAQLILLFEELKKSPKKTPRTEAIKKLFSIIRESTDQKYTNNAFNYFNEIENLQKLLSENSSVDKKVKPNMQMTIETRYKDFLTKKSFEEPNKETTTDQIENAVQETAKATGYGKLNIFSKFLSSNQLNKKEVNLKDATPKSTK